MILCQRSPWSKGQIKGKHGQKELGNSDSINVFCAGAINYPLHKAMVYHDHDRIKTVRVGQSGDEIY